MPKGYHRYFVSVMAILDQVVHFIRNLCMDLHPKNKKYWIYMNRHEPRIFHLGGGADPDAIYNFCLILKTML